jgi:hypothetical protein
VAAFGAVRSAAIARQEDLEGGREKMTKKDCFLFYRQ